MRLKDGRAIVVSAAAACVAALWPAAPASAFLDKGAEVSFSANFRASGENTDFLGKVFVRPGQRRLEIDDPAMGGTIVIIIDEEANQVRMLDTERETYTGYPLTDAGLELYYPDWSRLHKTEQERELVNGIGTTRYVVDQSNPDGGSTHGHMWISDDGIIVRYEGTTSTQGMALDSRFDLTGIRIRPLDDALFEVPDGYVSESGEEPGDDAGDGEPADIPDIQGVSPEDLEAMAAKMRAQGVPEAEIERTLRYLKRVITD